MMALVGVKHEAFVSEPNALTTRQLLFLHQTIDISLKVECSLINFVAFNFFNSSSLSIL